MLYLDIQRFICVWIFLFIPLNLQAVHCGVFQFLGTEPLESEKEIAELYLKFFSEFGPELLNDSLVKTLRRQNNIFDLPTGLSGSSETLRDGLHQLEKIVSTGFDKNKLKKVILVRLTENRKNTKEQRHKEKAQSDKIFEPIKVLAEFPYKSSKALSDTTPDGITLTYQNGNPLLVIKEEGLDGYSVIDGHQLKKYTMGKNIPVGLHGAPSLIAGASSSYLFLPQKDNVFDSLEPQFHLIPSGLDATDFKRAKKMGSMEQITAVSTEALNQSHYLIAVSRKITVGESRIYFVGLKDGVNTLNQKTLSDSGAGSAVSTVESKGLIYTAFPDRAGDPQVLKFDGKTIRSIKLDTSDGLLSQRRTAPGLVVTKSGDVKLSYATQTGVNFINLARPKLMNQVVRPEISSNFMKRVAHYKEGETTYGVVGNDTGLYRLNYDLETLDRIDGPYVPYSDIEIFENDGQFYALFTEERRRGRYLTLYGLSSGVEISHIEYPDDGAIGVKPYRMGSQIRAVVLHKKHMEVLKLELAD